MMDVHGNNIDVGDSVYILAERVGGSQSKMLLYGKITAIEKSMATVHVWANNRDYNKRSSTILKPYES